MREMDRRQDADVDLRIAERGALSSEDHVAGNRYGHPASARRAADGRDGRLAEIVLGVVELDVELLEELPDLLCALAEQDVEVETGGETLRYRAGNHDDACLRVVGSAIDCGHDGADHFQAQRIDRGPREHDARDLVRTPRTGRSRPRL